MRRGGIVALQWKYVDLDCKVVTVAHSDHRGHLRPTKGQRILPLPPGDARPRAAS